MKTRLRLALEARLHKADPGSPAWIAEIDRAAQEMTDPEWQTLTEELGTVPAFVAHTPTWLTLRQERTAAIAARPLRQRVTRRTVDPDQAAKLTSLYLGDALRTEIDDERGLVPRATWIKLAIREKLDRDKAARAAGRVAE